MTDISRRGLLAAGAAGVSAPLLLTTAEARADNGHSTGLRPVKLTTNHLTKPLGVPIAAPRLSWQLSGRGSGRRQTGYQIRIATDPDLLPDRGDVWDSGRVDSSQQTAISPDGPDLSGRTRYYWTVRVWDEQERAGSWSRTSWFETALPDEPWQAQWIGSGAEVPEPTVTLAPERFFDDPIEPDHELGQTFEVSGGLAAVAVLLTVTAENARVGMMLRQETADGPEIASTEVAVAKGEAQARLDLSDPLPAGHYYLGLTSTTGGLGWQSRDGDPADADPEQGTDGSPYSAGAAFADGSEVAELRDRWLYALTPDPPPNPLLRRRFQLADKPATARLYLVGLGHGRAFINGRRIDDAELTPPYTDYSSRVLYTTHDVTRQLRRGDNVLGVALGRGLFATRAPDSDGTNLQPWTSEPQLLAQLEITLPDGRREIIASGPEWQLTEGPDTYDGLYTGESHDARRAEQLAGWSTPGFDDGDWSPARPVDAPDGALEPYPDIPIRCLDPIRPVRVSEVEPGTWQYDFGEVVGGWVRFSGPVKRGATVSFLQHEKLDDHGRIDPGAPGGVENPSISGRLQRDEYIGAGGKAEWQPAWGYKSFQYVEVSGADRQLDLVAVPVRSDIDTTMALEVDQPVLQWIVEATRRTSLNGMHGHPDTSGLLKMGWLAQGLQADTTQLFGLDSAPQMTQWLDNIRAGQNEQGNIALYTPMAPWPILASPSTTAAYPHLVRQFHLHHGDPTIAQQHYPSVRSYVEFVLTQLVDGLAFDQFGDWYPPLPNGQPVPPEGGQLVGTAYVINTLRDAAAIAEVADEHDQAEAWRQRATELTDTFNEVFLDRDQGIYRTGLAEEYRQASNAVPLHLGLVPDDMVEPVAAQLAAAVEAADRHLDTGSFGTRSLPYALGDQGNGDLALDVLTTQTFPGYGYWRSLGATTCWEKWQADARSHNDPTLSSPVGWLLSRVVGLEPTEPGWARFRVAPQPYGELRRAGARLDTVRGRVAVEWRRHRRGMLLRVDVPVNSTADIVLPSGEDYRVGSGHYRFVSRD